MKRLTIWGRALRAGLWWWRPARLYFSVFVLAMAGAAALGVDWPWWR